MTETQEAQERRQTPSEAQCEGRGWLTFAKVLSVVFRPNYYPTVVFFFLLNFTFLQMLPFMFRLYVLAIVYLLTFAVPHIGMRFYRRTGEAHNYMVPYVINILSYLVCLHFVWKLHMPSFMLSVLAISVCVQCACTIISIWWRVSIHSAATGAVISALMVYASLLGFNPVWWLCIAILISGLVGSSRMLLRRHTLWQVIGGTWVGIGCGLIGIMLV